MPLSRARRITSARASILIAWLDYGVNTLAQQPAAQPRYRQQSPRLILYLNKQARKRAVLDKDHGHDVTFSIKVVKNSAHYRS